MPGTIRRSVDKTPYLHPAHDRFLLRDLVTADLHPELSVHRGQIAPGGEIRPHCHDRQRETFYILSGKAICCMNGLETPLQAGDCVVAPAGVTHGLRNEGADPVELLALFTPPLK